MFALARVNLGSSKNRGGGGRHLRMKSSLSIATASPLGRVPGRLRRGGRPSRTPTAARRDTAARADTAAPAARSPTRTAAPPTAATSMQPTPAGRTARRRSRARPAAATPSARAATASTASAATPPARTAARPARRPTRGGTCLQRPAGSTPRKTSDCTADSPATCGLDGYCDGAGACRNYGPTITCQGGTCNGDSVVGAFACDGDGRPASRASR